MTNDQQSAAVATPIETGAAVYDDDGTKLGHVREFTPAGFEVTVVEPERSAADSATADGEAIEHRPGQEFGEGYIMWRCGECGEMGELDEGMPATCPNCGAPEEVIQTVEED